MYYIDTDVLIHSLVKQNLNLHITVKALLNQFVGDNKLAVFWLSVQKTGFVLGKLNQSPQSITSCIAFLNQFNPLQYGSSEFNSATTLAEITGYKNFNDCPHIAIAEQHCSAFYTCNIKDFQRLGPHPSIKINFIK